MTTLFVWDHASIAQLTQLWGEGHSAVEIGRRMGLSKSAVVGKAHRLKLMGRPSPIRPGKTGELAKSRIERAPRVTLDLDASRQRGTVRIVGPTLPVAAPLNLPERRSTPVGQARMPIARATLASVKSAASAPRPINYSTCRWPLGEPGTPEFRFCCDPVTTLGKPYCDDHCEVAYDGFRRREAAHAA